MRGIRVLAPRHPEQADDVHREERERAPREREPEADLAQALVVHPPGDLREPVVHPAEQREHRGAEDHEVEVRDDVVRVRQLLVERDRRERDPRQPADDEKHDEADDPEQRRRKARGPGDDRRDPRE